MCVNDHGENREFLFVTHRMFIVESDKCKAKILRQRWLLSALRGQGLISGGDVRHTRDFASDVPQDGFVIEVIFGRIRSR